MPQTGGAINRPPKPKTVKKPAPKPVPAAARAVQQAPRDSYVSKAAAAANAKIKNVSTAKYGGSTAAREARDSKKYGSLGRGRPPKAVETRKAALKDVQARSDKAQAKLKRQRVAARADTGGTRQVIGKQVQRQVGTAPSRGGSSFGSPNTAPVRVDRNDRIGPTPITVENPGAYFDRPDATRAAGAGGGTGGATNPLNAGSDSLKGKDLEGILHGAKRRGRVRLARGTE